MISKANQINMELVTSISVAKFGFDLVFAQKQMS